eukprot:SAG22_NODE_2_length_61565_cov_858.782010_55_plen_84_part_00
MSTPTLVFNEKGLMEEILKRAKLNFIIEMPQNLFSEQKRKISTSIFSFTKIPHTPRDEVLFYHLEEDGFVSIPYKGKSDKYNK